MNRIQLIVMVGFALAFAAGGSVGMLIRPDGARETQRRLGPRRHLAKELGLTAEQQAQMRKIWSEVMGGQGMKQLRERGLALHRQRSQAIEALFTDEQRRKYEEILANHDREMEKIGQERHRLVEEAVERTKKILSAEQAKKYEEMRRGHRRGPGGRPQGPFGRGWRGGPATRPGGRGLRGMAPGRSGRPVHWPEEHSGQRASEEAANPAEP